MTVQFKEGVAFQDTIRSLITEDVWKLGITEINELLKPYDAKIFSINTESVPGMVIESTKTLLLG